MPAAEAGSIVQRQDPDKDTRVATITAKRGATVDSEEPKVKETFERLSARFTDLPEVSSGTGFGSSPGLRVGGKIFAMLVRDQLVVKLPKIRVDELVASGTAERFDRGNGQLMKEWAATSTGQERELNQLMTEALEFVRSGRRQGSTKTNRRPAGERP
jgi:TfoX/Sxy family transcriptional regulator of competence genes